MGPQPSAASRRAFGCVDDRMTSRADSPLRLPATARSGSVSRGAASRGAVSRCGQQRRLRCLLLCWAMRDVAADERDAAALEHVRYRGAFGVQFIYPHPIVFGLEPLEGEADERVV